MIGILDRVVRVDDRVDRAVHALAVVNRDAVLAVNGDPQIPFAALLDVLDVPEVIAEFVHDRQEKFLHGLGDILRTLHLQ